jgi:hypothetical protein
VVGDGKWNLLLELNGLIWHGAQLQLGEPSQCPVREYMSISGPPSQVAAHHMSPSDQRSMQSRQPREQDVRAVTLATKMLKKAEPSDCASAWEGQLLGGAHTAPIWAGQFAYRSGPTERECSSSPRRSYSPQHTVGGDGLETERSSCIESEELGSHLGEEGILRGNIERYMGARPAPLACRVGGTV